MRLALENGDELDIDNSADLAGALARLDPNGADTFAILSKSDDHFLQTLVNDQGYVIEKREGSDESHVRAARPQAETVPAPALAQSKQWWGFSKTPAADYFSLAETEQVFASYADGRPAPSFVAWVKLEPQS